MHMQSLAEVLPPFAAPPHFEYKRREPQNTVLYKVVQDNLNTFLKHIELRDKPLPAHVVKEFYDFLDCGILAKGFLRVACTKCQDEKLVAFACRGRGFCPACMGRRMNETAVFLVDHVLPMLPIRQWVLSFPFPIRYILAKNPKHITKCLQIYLRVIDGFYISQARTNEISGKIKCAAVTAIQRFGGSVNLNVHFHSLTPDGVFATDSDGVEHFHRLPGPTDLDVKKTIQKISKRILNYFQRQGLLDGSTDSIHEDQTELIDELAAASISSKIATGPRQGERVRKFGQVVELQYQPKLTGPKCASHMSFSLHANTLCEPHERVKLERLCKYINRPPLANDRVLLSPDGKQILYKMKSPYQDGTTHLLFDPLEFIEKLASLVPPPRMHMIRYHGVFAPNSKARPQVVLKNKVQKDTLDKHEIKPPSSAAQISWGRLMKRVFQIDITKCGKCGGDTKVIAAILEKKVIEKILTHLGLASVAPPIHPARAPPQLSFEYH